MTRSKTARPIATIQELNKVSTHVVQPAELPPGWICLDVTLEVNVIAFLDVIRVESASQHKRDDWWDWRKRKVAIYKLSRKSSR
jgi:hypothetical protein